MRDKFIAALFAAATLSCASGAASGDARQSPTGTLEVAGQERVFKVYDPNGRAPNDALVILLHGGTGHMSQVMDSELGRDWRALAEEHGFLLLAPNGTNGENGDPKGRRQHWNDYRNPTGARGEADDVAFIRALVDWAVERRGVDRRRVFVNGISNGGMMTFRLLQDAPGVFRAGAAYVANLPTATPERSFPPTPILLIHGEDDPVMKWEGGEVGARGQQDTVWSAPRTLDWWIARNRARTPAARTFQLPDQERDGCQLITQTFAPGDEGARVVWVVMKGGGHAAPSTLYGRRQRFAEKRLIGRKCRDASAADLAWALFEGSLRE